MSNLVVLYGQIVQIAKKYFGGPAPWGSGVGGFDPQKLSVGLICYQVKFGGSVVESSTENRAPLKEPLPRRVGVQI